MKFYLEAWIIDVNPLTVAYLPAFETATTAAAIAEYERAQEGK